MSIKFKQRKPYLVKEAGEWKFTFHYKEGSIERTFLSITSTSGIFNCRIGGNTHAFGYLLAAATQDRVDQLAGYAVKLYLPAMMMTQDQELTSDVQNAINKCVERMSAKAESAAGAITEEQDQGNQALMGDVVSEADMSESELKTKREADKELLKEIITGKEDGE